MRPGPLAVVRVHVTVDVPVVAVTVVAAAPTVSIVSVVGLVCLVARYVIPLELNRLMVGSNPTAELRLSGSVAPT